ncbi:MAG: hypothetical protein E7311_04555 [Clostridiales bacterium]|nr:hypothetical protein [Clostridiales bacterium]
MKLNKILCVLFIFSLMFTISVLAYSDEKYEIDIPEKYVESVDEDTGTITFNKLTDNFNIIVKENKNGANVVNFTEDEIKAIEEDIDRALEKANMPNEIISSKIVKVNNYDALLIKSQCKQTPESEKYIYQYKYIFTSKNNVYYITYTTTQKELYDSFKDVIDTFEIKDEVYEQTSNLKNNQEEGSEQISFYLIIVLIIVVVILISAIVVVFIKIRK